MMNREEEDEYIKKLEKMTDTQLEEFERKMAWKQQDLDQETRALKRHSERRCYTDRCGKTMRFVQGVEYAIGAKNLYQCPKCKSAYWDKARKVCQQTLGYGKDFILRREDGE